MIAPRACHPDKSVCCGYYFVFFYYIRFCRARGCYSRVLVQVRAKSALRATLAIQMLALVGDEIRSSLLPLPSRVQYILAGHLRSPASLFGPTSSPVSLRPGCFPSGFQLYVGCLRSRYRKRKCNSLVNGTELVCFGVAEPRGGQWELTKEGGQRTQVGFLMSFGDVFLNACALKLQPTCIVVREHLSAGHKCKTCCSIKSRKQRVTNRSHLLSPNFKTRLIFKQTDH